MDDGNVWSGEGNEQMKVTFNSLAVGNEHEKLKFIVLSHLENMFSNKLFDKISDGRCLDEVTITEACEIIKSLQSDVLEQEACCFAFVNLLNTEKKNLLELDDIITKIVFSAYNQGAISLLLACQCLVTSIDFKATIPLNKKKIEFVRKQMHQLDYKNMRDLLKLLLAEKLDKMECSLTAKQHKELMPIEDLMIDLIDRKKNYCPALFFITEISRISANSSVHFLPRISLKIREMVASFRPLAEIASMIGRSWMYPITTQVGFSWNYLTWATWKLQESNCRLYFKTHLPYSNENMASQTYLQYMLLKQPRGQENILHILKSSTSHINSPKLQCNKIIYILILEAMCAMEDSEISVLALYNQYNWMHLCYLLTYALSIGCCTLQQLLPMLQYQLKKCQYQKAKAELMWILLQFIASAKSKSTSFSQNKNQLDVKNKELILDIFNVLYPEEMVWTGCSTDCLSMVRFFASASLWINLSYYPNSSTTTPPDKVQQHIDFLKSQLESGVILENGLLAVIANTYSNNLEIFETHVSKTVLKMLGAMPDLQHHSSFSNIQQWTLPLGRKADGCLVALHLSLLDSFTFHAKKMLYTSLTSYLQNYTNNGFLPSPALIETLSRILLTMEIGDSIRLFIDIFCKMIQSFYNKESHQHCELIVICIDIINYRLQSLQINFEARLRLILCAFDGLNIFGSISDSQSRTLYSKFEQLLMRQIMIASPLDLNHIVFYLLNRTSNTQAIPVYLFVSSDAFAHADRQYGYYCCPEISRMIILNLIRAHKLLAASSIWIVNDLVYDYITPTRQCYKWSNSTVKWFPAFMQNMFEIETALCSSVIKNLQDVSDREYCFLMNGNNAEMDKLFLPNYRQVTLLISVFKCHFELSHFPPYAYKVLATLNAKDLILNTNAFVDFIIWRSQNLDCHKSYDRLVYVVNEMIFVNYCIPVERFLLSLILHLNDDTSIEYALLLLSNLLQKYRHFSQLILDYCNFAPLHSNLPYSKSEDFFTKLYDYYMKHQEKTYLEMYFEMTKGSMAINNETEKHLPVYYDNLPERILPIIDVLFQRSLEIAVTPQILTTFLKNFAPLYKFHPQPLTFLYKTLYSFDSLGTFSHTAVAREFVMEIVKRIDDERNPKFVGLSQEFVIQGHDMPVIKICQVLIDRIISASTYIHHPPSFVARDWRFTEYPPAAQALTGAWIELLASPYNANDVTEGIVELAMKRPINRPYDTINAIGLLLTGLPMSYQNVFLKKIIESFDWLQVLNNEPAILFETLNQEIYLYSDNKIISMLALIHSFCQHAGNNSLSILPDFFAEQLASKVQNETQLMYLLRILVPYLQRINDKEKTRHMNEYLKLIISIYNVLGSLVEKIGQLKYEDVVCDLLYQFKYMFVGYSLKNEAEQAIEKFPESMREKLKFLLMHSSSAEQQKLVNHQQQYHQLAQLPLMQHQFSQAAALVSASGTNNSAFGQMPHPANTHNFHQLAAVRMLGMPVQQPAPTATIATSNHQTTVPPVILQQQNHVLNIPNNSLNNSAPTLAYSNLQKEIEKTNSNTINQHIVQTDTSISSSSSMPTLQQYSDEIPPPPPYSQNSIHNTSTSSINVSFCSTVMNSGMSETNFRSITTPNTSSNFSITDNSINWENVNNLSNIKNSHFQQPSIPLQIQQQMLNQQQQNITFQSDKTFPSTSLTKSDENNKKLNDINSINMSISQPIHNNLFNHHYNINSNNSMFMQQQMQSAENKVGFTRPLNNHLFDLMSSSGIMHPSHSDPAAAASYQPQVQVRQQMNPIRMQSQIGHNFNPENMPPMI